MGDGFYGSKDPTNSIKVLKEKATKKNPEKQKTSKGVVLKVRKQVVALEQQQNSSLWTAKEKIPVGIKSFHNTTPTFFIANINSLTTRVFTS